MTTNKTSQEQHPPGVGIVSASLAREGALGRNWRPSVQFGALPGGQGSAALSESSFCLINIWHQLAGGLFVLLAIEMTLLSLFPPPPRPSKRGETTANKRRRSSCRRAASSSNERRLGRRFRFIVLLCRPAATWDRAAVSLPGH